MDRAMSEFARRGMWVGDREGGGGADRIAPPFEAKSVIGEFGVLG